MLASRESQVTYSPAFVVGPGGGVTADGIELRHGAVFGRDTRPYFGSSIAVHETGHALGLPDLYTYALDGGRADRMVGSWDIMSSSLLGSGFLAWHSWKLRWLDRSQLRCYRGGGVLEVELAPLDAPGGVKAIVVPLDASRAWVLEVRRREGLDAHLCSEGVLAYLVDARVPSGNGPVRVRSTGRGDDASGFHRCGPLYDAPYDVGVGKQPVLTEPTFVVELLAKTSAGGYRIRATSHR